MGDLEPQRSRPALLRDPLPIRPRATGRDLCAGKHISGQPWICHAGV